MMSSSGSSSESEDISVAVSSASLPDSRPHSPVMDQNAMRRVIIAIQGDVSIDGKEKAKRMQDLMTAGKSLRRTNSLTSLRSSSSRDKEELEFPSVDKYDFVGEGGCEHYQRGCKLLSDCCQKWYDCRFCHNETEGHELDRFATKYMLCMHCYKPQKAAQYCQHCKACMGRYYCDICRLWDDDLSKQSYHCHGCGLCRKGPKSHYVHCDRCHSCMTTDRHKQHKCIERSLDSDCPICGEYLFTSTKSVTFMERCGHPIHFECLNQHVHAGNYQCPLCFKSVADNSGFFSQIDTMLSQEQMPAEYATLRSFVFCNDCERRSWGRYHFIYHKCQHCSSYNTKLLKTAQQGVEDEEASDHSGIAEEDPKETPESNHDITVVQE